MHARPLLILGLLMTVVASGPGGGFDPSPAVPAATSTAEARSLPRWSKAGPGQHPVPGATPAGESLEAVEERETEEDETGRGAGPAVGLPLLGILRPASGPRPASRRAVGMPAPWPSRLGTILRC